MSHRSLMLAAFTLVLTVVISARFVGAADDAADTTSLKNKQAIDFSFPTLDGKTAKLSEQKGSVVMMDFWATWCGPCRASLPHVNKLSQDKALAAAGLKVWAVNAHEDVAKVQKFVTENNYAFTVPLGTKEIMGSYLIHGIPTTIIVGRDGKIRDVFIGYGDESDKQIEAAVQAALAEKQSTSAS